MGKYDIDLTTPENQDWLKKRRKAGYPKAKKKLPVIKIELEKKKVRFPTLEDLRKG